LIFFQYKISLINLLPQISLVALLQLFNMSSFSSTLDSCCLLEDAEFMESFSVLRKAFDTVRSIVDSHCAQPPDLEELHRDSRPLTTADIHVRLQPPIGSSSGGGLRYETSRIVTPPMTPRSAPRTPPPIRRPSKVQMRRSTSAPPTAVTPVRQQRKQRRCRPRAPKKAKESPFKCSKCHQIQKYHNFSKNQMKRPRGIRKCRKCCRECQRSTSRHAQWTDQYEDHWDDHW